MPQPSIGQMFQTNLQRGLRGANADDFEANARRRGHASAMAIGAGMAGVSPALAARQATQAAAAQQASIGAQAAQMRMVEQQQAQQMAFQQQQADQARMDRFIGMGLQVAGSAGSMLMSDEDAKVALGGGREAADQLIDSLEPERFRYRPESGQPGDMRLGVMAQDVERGGPMGASMVGTRPDGYRGIDRDQAIGAILASVGRIGERLDSLEGGGRRRRGGR